MPLFPQNQQIIAIDIPGHGFSSHLGPDDSYDFEDLDYITTVAKYYNFEKFSLMGHSMGGRAALQFTAENQGISDIVFGQNSKFLKLSVAFAFNQPGRS